ncbi:MAG: phage baseplate assembly protein V [Oscillospiraceae bacterium]|nr:phage baseplate assembly protein V [Oscillospiraceae bacterium]
MALYDIIDEIAAQKATKSETGDTRINGIVLGIVAKNYDKDMPGRVCITVPTRDKDANELQWARLVQPSGGDKWGHYFLPEVGDQVVLAFEGGNIEKPYIIGCVPKDASSFLKNAVDENNQFKRIVTKNGSTLAFEDNKEGEGDKDKITLQTAKKSHTLLMDNENNIIRITDKEKENIIEMKTQDGVMKVKAKSKLTIEVGDNIKIVLNGESGAVKIEAEEVSIAASRQFKVKCDQMIKIDGAQIAEKASSMHKIESGGMVNIAGSPIKIG